MKLVQGRDVWGGVLLVSLTKDKGLDWTSPRGRIKTWEVGGHWVKVLPKKAP